MSTSNAATWPKRNAREFAFGRGGFIDDLRTDAMLHMAVVRSTRAHARLLGVDATRAERYPGVVRVLDGWEASSLLNTLPYQFGAPELLGADSRPLQALPTDEVRYVGEPVAVVVAENVRTARAAATAVTVSYDDLPAMLDPLRFLGVDHLDAVDAAHVIAENRFRSGDPESSLQRAPHVLDAEFSVGRSSAAPLETRGYLADWDQQSGRLTVHASHQQPFQLRAELAEVLGLSHNAIRVVVPNVGGSFGLKMTGQVEEPLVCLMSMLCARPVKWIETRAECMLGGAREQVHRVRVGFDDDGRLSTLIDDMVVPVGARSVSPGWRQAYVSAASLPTAYDVAHVDVRSRVIETNLPPWHSCRGFGKEAPIFVMERVMDLIARRLHLDPVEVRRRNLLQCSLFPHRMPSGYQIDSGDFHAVLESALDLAGHPAAVAAAATSGPLLRGIGVAFEITPEGGGHAAGRMGPGVILTAAASENATVRLDRSGLVTVLTGVTNPGGGNDTALANLAAKELGTTPDQVTVIQGDTDLCPPGTGNASSRGAAVGGAAVVLAARSLAEQLRKVVAAEFDAAPDDVTLAHSAAHAAGRAPMALAEVCRLALQSSADDWLTSTQSYHPTPPDDPDFRYSYPYFSSGAYVAEVDVDPCTGTVRVNTLTAVHDCGRVLEPVLVEGQLQGAMAMGVGLALFEQSRFDGEGTLAARTFKEYLTPRANDLPDFVIGHHETPAPYTLMGAKGAGEAGVGGALAAVANAVDDALHRHGHAVAPVTSVPMTPPVVLALTTELRGAP